MQWTMGIVATLTATSVAGMIQELKALNNRTSRLESETSRLPELERLLREVREHVSAIRAKLDDKE